MCRFFATNIFWNPRIRQLDYYSESASHLDSVHVPSPKYRRQAYLSRDQRSRRLTRIKLDDGPSDADGRYENHGAERGTGSGTAGGDPGIRLFTLQVLSPRWRGITTLLHPPSPLSSPR